MNMKRSPVLGLWLVLHIISTTQERVTCSNMNSSVTSEMILLPTPSISKYLDTKTFIVEKSSRNIIESRHKNISNVQSSEISKSGTLTRVFTPEHTRTQSARNSYNDTQSVRDILKNTQTWSVDLQIISSTENMLMRENTSYAGRTTSSVSQSTSPSVVTSQQSNIVQNTTGVLNRYSSANFSKAYSRVSPTLHSTGVLQSRIPTSQSRALNSTRHYSQVEFTVSRISNESSSNYRVLSRESTTQTAQLSRIINVSLSTLSVNVSVNGISNSRLSRTSGPASNGYSSHIHQSSTVKDFTTSKILSSVYISSTYRSSQFSRDGSKSSLTNTVYLSTTRNANSDSRIRPTPVVIAGQSISQTSPNEESINTGSFKTTLETVRLSKTRLGTKTFSTPATGMVTNQSELRTFTSSYTLASKTSDYHPGMTSKEVTVFASQETSSVTILNSSHPSGRGPSMPLYVLAICLPLAALLGFVLACVYFKRNKEDQRVRYSVTVEISAEKPDYEMKRMYSVIDVSSGINKDFLSGLESKKASSEILDQLDGISVSVTKPDQTV